MIDRIGLLFVYGPTNNFPKYCRKSQSQNTGPHWSDSAQLDNLLQHPMIVDVSSTQIPHMAWVDPRNSFQTLSPRAPRAGLNPQPSVFMSGDLTTRPSSPGEAQTHSIQSYVLKICKYFIMLVKKEKKQCKTLLKVRKITFYERYSNVILLSLTGFKSS